MADDSEFCDMIIRACMVTIVSATACRFVAVRRFRWQTRRRYPQGYCQECSYDLTGNASGVCPERGTKIEKEKADP